MQQEENAERTVTVGAAVIRVLDAETAQAIGAEQRQSAKREAAAFPELIENLRVGREPMIKKASQHHVELLQAIALARIRSGWTRHRDS